MPFSAADTAFMLVATALVLIMTPGLAFFYGGLIGRKNVLAIMMQLRLSGRHDRALGDGRLLPLLRK